MIRNLEGSQNLELSIEKQENYLPNENLAFEITKRLAFPRLIGSDGEKKAIFIVKDEFRKIGLEPISEKFQTSFANWVIIRLLFLILGTGLIASSIMFFYYPFITSLISILYIFICLYLSKLSGVIGTFGKTYITENIIGKLNSKLANANVVLMAHWDSKGQKFSGSVRIITMIISLFGVIVISTLYLIFGVLYLLGFYNSLINYGLFIGTICVISISFINVLNKITNCSPGAIDNAASVASLLTLARYFHYTNNIKNLNLYFVATGSEELNLAGASSFIKKHKLEFEEIPTYFINFDLIGGSEKLLMINAYGFPKKTTSLFLYNLFKMESKKLNIPFKAMYLPFGAWCDLMPILNEGFDGCWIASEGTFSLAHTTNDSIYNVSKKGLKNGIDLTIEVIKKIDRIYQNSIK
ncbi:MAG: M28 family peptidase [Candidatus Helarchaeota archaeon]